MAVPGCTRWHFLPCANSLGGLGSGTVDRLEILREAEKQAPPHAAYGELVCCANHDVYVLVREPSCVS